MQKNKIVLSLILISILGSIVFFIPTTKADNTNLTPLSPTNFLPLVNGHTIFETINGVYTMVVSPFDVEPYLTQFGGGDREVNSKALDLSIGSTINFQCDLSTDSPTIGNEVGLGAEVNIDAYGHDASGTWGRIEQINNDNGVGVPCFDGVNYVYNWVHAPWGTTLHFSMTWVVPSVLYSDGWGNFAKADACTPVYFFILIGTHSSDAGVEGALMYISNTVTTLDGSTLPFGSSVLGQSGIEITNTNDANTKVGSTFVAGQSGNISDINAYVGGTVNVKAAVYSGTTATAALLESSSTAALSSASMGWQTFHLATPVSVVAGNAYTLAIMGDNNLPYGLVSSGALFFNSNTFSSGFSSPFGAIVSSDVYDVSIYANIITSTPNTNPPQYSMESSAPNYAGGQNQFFIQWSDSQGLSNYIFQYNGVNATYAFLANTTTTSLSIFQTLPNTVGTIIYYRWYAENTANIWASTPLLSLTTISAPTPTPTPTPTIVSTPVPYQGGIFDFVGKMDYTTQLAFVGGIVLIACVMLSTVVKHRRN
jgi:hypothetical protein